MHGRALQAAQQSEAVAVVTIERGAEQKRGGQCSKVRGGGRCKWCAGLSDRGVTAHSRLRLSGLRVEIVEIALDAVNELHRLLLKRRRGVQIALQLALALNGSNNGRLLGR